MFPEIKAQLLNVFERYRHVLDVDLQQRACEFYALASRPDDDELLQNVCEEIPPFPARESTLLTRLNRKHGDTEDKRTWVHGGKDINPETQVSKRKTTLIDVNVNGASRAAPSANDTGEITQSLMGLDLSNSPVNIRPSSSFNDPSPSDLLEKGIPRLTVGANVDRWFEKLLLSPDGVLYEDVQIQIGIKSRYHGQFGQIAVYIGNKVSAPLTSFTAVVHTENPAALSSTWTKIAPNTIGAKAQTQQLLQLECKEFFSKPPILVISFLAGAHQTIAVQLPIVITKFIEHVKLTAADFFERWKLIGGPPREAQSIFPIALNSAGHIDITKQQQVVSGHSFSILEGIDPNPVNIVAAGILHMATGGKVGCLLRLEPNREAKV